MEIRLNMRFQKNWKPHIVPLAFAAVNDQHLHLVQFLSNPNKFNYPTASDRLSEKALYLNGKAEASCCVKNRTACIVTLPVN